MQDNIKQQFGGMFCFSFSQFFSSMSCLTYLNIFFANVFSGSIFFISGLQ